MSNASTSMPWNDAIKKVLEDHGATPTHYADIAKEIVDKVYRQPQDVGATPAITVCRNLNIELKDEVLRVQPGYYVLKKYRQDNIVEPVGQSGEDKDEDFSDAFFSAYGRFWSRSLFEENIDQKNKSKAHLYGGNIKQPKAISVDFFEHGGIYLLHKGYHVVYVGQATSLGKRLLEHTRDEHRNRWDGFSWFSITISDEFKEEGSSKKTTKKFKDEYILDTLEGMLIEVLGPERNRKAGNNFDDKEFEQLTETEFLKRQYNNAK